MTRKLTLFASILTATFAAYAAAQQSTVMAPTAIGIAGKPLPLLWIPPSFDVQTAPPDALWATEAVAPASPSPDRATVGEETWAADTSAHGTPSDASH